MTFREAKPEDITQMQVVRNAVKENRLSNPNLVTDEDCLDFISRRGKGWVCEINGHVVGFSIADLQEDNIWALFVDPNYEQKGIGRKLQKLMLDWYFNQGKDFVWLGTAPDTRAAEFYRRTGWMETGTHGPKEIKFELSKLKYEQQCS